VLAAGFPVVRPAVVVARLEAVVVAVVGKGRLGIVVVVIVIVVIVVAVGVVGAVVITAPAAPATTASPPVLKVMGATTIGRLLEPRRGKEPSFGAGQHPDVEIGRVVGRPGPGGGGLQQPGPLREVRLNVGLTGLGGL